MTTTTAPTAHIAADLARLRKAIEEGGWIIEIDDETFISPDCPEILARSYGIVYSAAVFAGIE